MLLLNMRLREEGAAQEERAIAAVTGKVTELIERDIPQEQLTRAINRMESAMMFNNVSYLAKAQALALCEYHGEDINGMTACYRRLTAADLKEAARMIFTPERANTLIYRPG